MRSQSFAAALVCAMGLLQLHAYDAVLNQKDSSATGLSCFTNAASWTPAGIPEEGKTYYADLAMMSPSGTTAYDENGIGTFKGALYLKKPTGGSQNSLYVNGYTWFKGGLHLLNTAYLRHSAPESHMKGDLYCEEHPNYVSIGHGSAETHVYWDGVDLKGNQRMCIVTDGKGLSKYLHWDGSMDAYTATTVLMADTDNSRLFVEFLRPVAFPTVTSFTLRNGVVLRPTNAASPSTFKHLKLDRTAISGYASDLDPVNGATLAVNGTLELSATTENSATYRVPTNGTVTAQTLKITSGVTLAAVYDGTADSTRHPFEVTSTLTLPSTKIPVTVRYAAKVTGGPGEVQILKVPTSVRTITPEDFTVVSGRVEDIPEEYHLPTITNMVVKVEDGMQTLCLYPRDLVRLTKKETDHHIGGYADCWSDGRIPHSGADYYTAGFDSRLSGSFPAETSLSVNKLVQTWNIAVDDLRVGPIQFQSYGGLNWRGHAYLLYDSTYTMNVLVYSGNYAAFPLSVELSGPGNFWLMYRGAKTDALWGGNVYLTGLNTNWTGSLRLSCQTGTDNYKFDTGKHNVTLFIEDERNLGGKLETFAYDAFRIADQNVLAVTNDVTLSAAQNRGVYIENDARFNVTSQTTLAVNRQITFNGRLKKEGAGTLALGGKPKFTDGTSDTPVENLNQLNVAAGAIQPLAASAFDGLAVSFADNTAIVLAADATDADLVAYGMKNTNWTTPFSWPEGFVDVKFTRAGGDWSTFRKTQLGVLTVADEVTAQAARTKLRAVYPQKNLAATFSVRANADTTYTVVATLAQSGCMVIFR